MNGRSKILVALRPLGIALFAVPWIGVPIWMVLVNSAKPAGEAAALTLDLPQQWGILENYAAVFIDGNYLRALGNSLLVSVPTIAVIILLGASAAWGFGRSGSRFQQVLFYSISLSMLMPPTLIPTIYLLQGMQLDGSMVGYIAVLIGSRMGIVVFLATGFVRSMPQDLEAAASLDGANKMQVLVRIVLPLLAPVLFVGGVILVITVWGDFFFAQFLLTGTAQQTLPLALYSFASSSAQTLRWNLVFAHVVMTALPLVIAFVFAQRRVVGGLTEGALKG